MVAAAVVVVAVSISCSSSSSSSSSNMSSNSSSNTRSSCKLYVKKRDCWYCNTKPQAITSSQILMQNLLREISTTTHTKQPKRLQQLCTVTNTSTKVIIGTAIQKSSHHTFANTNAKFLRREISTASTHAKHSTEMAV